jgi:hypothetical protein
VGSDRKPARGASTPTAASRAKGSPLCEKALVVLVSGAALAGGEAIRTRHTSVGSALGYVLGVVAGWAVLSLALSSLERRIDRRRRR